MRLHIAIVATAAMLLGAADAAAQTGRRGSPTRATIDARRPVPVQLRTDRTATVRLSGRNLDRQLTRPQVLQRGRPLRGVTAQLVRGTRGTLDVRFVVRPGVSLPAGEPLELVFYDERTRLRVPIEFEPAPAPDLVVVDHEFVESTIASAEPLSLVTTRSEVWLRATIRNIGNAPAVYPDGSTLFWVWNPTNRRDHSNPPCMDEIPPGAECVGTVLLANPEEVPLGEYTLRIEADPLDDVAEGREDNNEREIDFVVEVAAPAAGAPDLEIQDVDVAADEAVVTVVNSGGGDVYLDANIDIVSASQHFEAARMIGGVWLEPGDVHYAVLERAPGCATGEDALTFTVDPNHLIEEKDENNNDVVVDDDLVGSAMPDLVIRDVVFIHDPPLVAGTPITTEHALMIEVKVENTGLGPACLSDPLWRAAESPLSGELDGTTGWDELPAGEEVRSWAALIEPGQLAAGTYDFNIVVDPDGVVPETNELNNVFKARLVIEPDSHPPLP